MKNYVNVFINLCWAPLNKGTLKMDGSSRDNQWVQNKRQDGDVLQALRVIDNAKEWTIDSCRPGKSSNFSSGRRRGRLLEPAESLKGDSNKINLSGRRDGLIPFY